MALMKLWVIKLARTDFKKTLLLLVSLPHQAHLEYELPTARLSRQSSRALLSVKSLYNVTYYHSVESSGSLYIPNKIKCSVFSKAVGLSLNTMCSSFL